MKNKLVKLIITLILFNCLVLILNGCNEHIVELDDNNNVNNTNYVARETFAYSLPIINQLQLRLSGINGNIHVNGRLNSNSVIIEGEKRVGSESQRDAEIHLAELKVIVEDLANKIYVETSQPDHPYGRRYEVDYTITVPENFKIYIENVNGSINADSLTNNINIANINGSVILDNISGSASIDLVNGLIQSNQWLPLNGTIDFTIVNGNIELDIPQTTSAEFYASVVNGNIELSNLILRNELLRNNSVSGTLGEGEGTISLGTTNGSIYVIGF